MTDPVYAAFLEKQLQQGMALARDSDLLDLLPIECQQGPPDRYIARFGCQGLVRNKHGEVVPASDFHVGILFPEDYLRRVDPFQTLTWLYPRNIFHPNISPRAPLICVGRIAPGEELTDLLYRLFEIISYHNWAPHDGLNPEACQWARNNQHRFPTDRRPLKRRTLALNATDLSEAPQ